MKNGQQALVRGVDEWYMIFSIQTLFERETLLLRESKCKKCLLAASLPSNIPSGTKTSPALKSIPTKVIISIQ